MMLPPVYYALLSLQSALINSVAPQLRAATVDVNEEDKRIIVWFFYDGNVSEELFELASIAATETECPGYLDAEHIVRLDFPAMIPIRGKLAFLRKEPTLPKFKRENRSFFLKLVPPLAVFRLDMQEALLGKITPPLRHVVVGVDSDQKRLLSHFIYDGEISEEDYDLATSAIQEARGSFPDYEVDSRIERCDFPNHREIHGTQAVYLRQEFKY